MKKLLSFALALAMTLSLAGCAAKPPAPTAAPTAAPTVAPTATPAPAAGPVSFTDSCGRTVELPGAITRIVPSGPLAQMVLFALAPELFVGLATNWSKETEGFIDGAYYNLPVLGQLYGTSAGELNLETLAAADPQLILDIGEPKKTIVADMDSITEQLGIPAVHIDAYTATMGDTYRMLGKLLGKQAQGEKLAAYCDETYASALALEQNIAGQKAKVIYCLGDKGLNVLAKTSYHAEVLDLLTDNLAVVDSPSSKGTGNESDMEQLLLWDPEVILFAPGEVYEMVGSDKTWQSLSAIQSGSYYEVPFGPYNWMGFPPSVNRYLGILWLSDLLYPAEAKIDLFAEVSKYYDLFYHCKLTQAQFDSLTVNSLKK